MVVLWPLLMPFSGTFNGGVSLCYHPPSQPPSLPGNYHKLHFPCPPEPKELSGRSGRIVTFIIFSPFSFHRLIFQEGLSLLYRRAERGIESKVGAGCRGVGGCGGDWAYSVKGFSHFLFFFSWQIIFHAGVSGGLADNWHADCSWWCPATEEKNWLVRIMSQPAWWMGERGGQTKCFRHNS